MENKFLVENVDFAPEGIRGDRNTPYSFLEWKSRRPKFDESDIKIHYNRYLIEWFEENKRKSAQNAVSLKQKYLFLLKQLQFFFSDEEKQNWYSKINTADEKELLLGIPYFAKKLKDISLYYLRLRRNIKKSKFRYNTIGTKTGIENVIYTKILEAFTDKTEESFFSIIPNTPSVEDLRKNLVVKIEELYDDKTYLDHSTSMPVSAYYDLLDEATEKFYQTKGIVLSSSEWFFNCLNIPVTSDPSTFVDQITSNILESTDTETYISFVQNFLSEKKTLLTNTVPPTANVFFDFDLIPGDNVFYYPYGSTENIADLNIKFKPFPLSSLNLDGATAGESIETADTMFVKVGNETKAAWLQFKRYQEQQTTMESFLEKDARTRFIFPYPGYGVLGPELPWTGVGLKTDQEYKFLTKENKSLVDSLYWSSNVFENTCDSILLNNSNLAKNGAFSNKNPNLADQLFIRPAGSNNTETISEETNGSWLYKFDKTCLPVFSNSSNTFLWPYTVLDTEAEFPEIFQNLNFSDVCDITPIEKIKLPYAIAGTNIDTADKIYKLRNAEDTLSEAIECAWLSGRNAENEKYEYAASNCFTALFESGKSTRFIWNGPDTPLNEVFKAPKHAKDCPFSIGKATINEPSKCTCKQIYFSLFGHPGDSFSDNNAQADCIVLDTENNGRSFDLGSWRSLSGVSIQQDRKNREFAWYQTNVNKGWGDGEWMMGPLPIYDEFILQRGKTYFYTRVDSGFSNERYPNYAVYHTFNPTLANGVWMEGKLDTNGNWLASGKRSYMEIAPGDIIRYERQNSTKFNLISSEQFKTFSRSTGKNAWANIDILAINEDTPQVFVAWPNFIEKFDRLDPQYPSVTFAHVSAINYWEIELVNSLPLIKERVYGNANLFFLQKNSSTNPFDIATSLEDVTSNVLTFTPKLTGLYKIRVSARMRSNEDLIFDNIPLLTAVPGVSSVRITQQLETPSPGFLIEHDLTGWNYNKNKFIPFAKGAKPYWAVLYTRKERQNRFKGVQFWGYDDVTFYNDYLPKRNPEISQLTINHGNVLEYRRRGDSINWKQDLTFKTAVNTTTWCQLSFETLSSDNLSEIFRAKEKPELNVLALDLPSDIIISNDIKGQAPEIIYYAQNPFTWTSVVQLEQETFLVEETFFDGKNKSNNLANRFYPTIATLPVLENVKTEKEIGGYFLPQNLGASVLVNKNFEINLKSSYDGATTIGEDVEIHVGGLGLTKQSQNTIFEWSEDNEWMMEAPTAGMLAGAPKKFLTKQLQTFVPYEINKEETPLGLVNSTSKFSPWGGPDGEQWIDVLNEPKSFTGVRNVSAWIQSQTLKQKDYSAECWTTDLYGNQYGLYKKVDNKSSKERREAGGELWIRNNSQVVLPSYILLSSVYSPFEGTSVFTDLTGSGIKFFESYYDTLMFETSSVVYFAEVKFDFDKQTYTFIYDNTKTINLSSNYFWYDNNWFFSTRKKITNLLTLSTDGGFVPNLWELDLTTKKGQTVFPSLSEKVDILTKTKQISAQSLSRGLVHYNEDYQTFLITYDGKTVTNDLFIINFYVKEELNYVLQKIDIFTSKQGMLSSLQPPALLETVLDSISVSANNSFSYTLSCYNSPTNFELLNYKNQINLNQNGTFTGILTSNGIYHVNYKVSNSAGSVDYALTIVVE